MALPDLAFLPDGRKGPGHRIGRSTCMFYGSHIDPVTRYHRSEAFAFCDRVHAAGTKLKPCPWMHADHIGNHRFSDTSTDAALLRIGLAFST